MFIKQKHVGWVVGAGLLAVLIIGMWWVGTKEGMYQMPVTTSDAKSETPPVVKSTSKPLTKTTTTAPAPIEKVYSKGYLSISDLLKLNTTSSCGVTSNTPFRAGTLYLSGKKVRVDFTNKVSMIDDGTYVYVWSSGETKGLKVTANSTITGNAIIMRGGLDLYTPLTYKCAAWTPDATLFTPPSITYVNSEGYAY